MQVTSLVNLIDTALPQWVHIMPAGAFSGNDGRGPFFLTDPQAVIAASKRPTVEMVVDRDHELVKDINRNTPAAGWVKDIEEREDGLWANVEWTPHAKWQIQSKEYRYISPVFFSHKKSGEVKKIRHLSLVNEPALELKAVAGSAKYTAENQLNEKKEDVMNKEQLKALALAFGLSADKVTEDDIVAAATEQSKALESAMSHIDAINSALGLDNDADHEEVIAAATQMQDGKTQPDPAQFVPMSMYSELQTRLTDLEETNKTGKATELVAAAMKAGKITPAQKDWAENYAKTDPTGFEAFAEKQPVIVQDGEELGADKNPGQQAGKLSEVQASACKMLGLSEEKYLKTITENKGDE